MQVTQLIKLKSQKSMNLGQGIHKGGGKKSEMLTTHLGPDRGPSITGGL